ncbi:hypothetical protein AHAS_Ahas17G0267200 [Arachis hypogaea]
MLKVFGCLCYPHTRPYIRHKLQFQSEPCVYLGPAASYKGFKCLTSAEKIVIVRDVRFQEDVFLYEDNSFGFNNTQLPHTQSINS